MDDVTLLSQFEDLTLPAEDWTHRTHVKVAYLYLRDYPLDDAIARMCKGIRAFNGHHNVPETATEGYNETTTQAFLRIIHAVMNAYASAFPVSTADEFCDTHPQFMSKHILRMFYSPQQRMHPDAKTTFIPPDLAPLPTCERSPAS